MRASSGQKAYTVTDGDEGWVILFADRSVVARREGAAHLDVEFCEVESCRRTTWADRYWRTGEIPASAMVEHGWHFECQGCGVRIDDDWLSEQGRTCASVVGTQHSGVFCGPDCKARETRRRALRTAFEQRWLLRLQRVVTARFPDAELVESAEHVWDQHACAEAGRCGRFRIAQVTVAFAFPGMAIGPAFLRINRSRTGIAGRGAKPYYTCHNGDLGAFRAWAARWPGVRTRREVGREVEAAFVVLADEALA
ncbi:MAG: hypothetical protein KIS90_00700 [Phenylobacterium sp.]|nr:hypothetical protein [Phenylobacterium sp.]